MNKMLTRRSIVKSGLMAGACVPALGLLGNVAQAAELPPLDPTKPAPSAMGFVTDASKVNAAANPTFKPGQTCANCVQYQGKVGDPLGTCNIFAGRTVPAKGWCKIWSVMPG